MTALSPAGTVRPSISMLGWGLNEREYLPFYLYRAETFLRSVTGGFWVVVVDAGSSDGMRAVATEGHRTRPWLKLLKNERNSAAAYSAKRAIRAATKDYIFWQTVDWAYDISGLAAAFPMLREFDILQGV